MPKKTGFLLKNVTFQKTMQALCLTRMLDFACQGFINLRIKICNIFNLTSSNLLE